MFRRRITMLVLFLVPIAYVGLIGSVAVHEVLGHGGTALLLGGQFDGFQLKWDGMGYARTSPAPGAPVSHSILILIGGPGATTVVGLALLVAARLARRSIPRRMALLVLSLFCLLEGPPYFFWNAYQPLPPGDIGQILALLPAAGSTDPSYWRWGIMIVGGVISLTATVVILALLFQALEESLGTGERLGDGKRAAVLAVFLAVPGSVAWLVFDWDQLAPGVGMLPSLVGSATVVLTVAGLFWFSLAPRQSPSLRNVSLGHVLASWATGAVVVAMMWLWLVDGLSWA
jgi:hypothetical protein